MSLFAKSQVSALQSCGNLATGCGKPLWCTSQNKPGIKARVPNICGLGTPISSTSSFQSLRVVSVPSYGAREGLINLMTEGVCALESPIALVTQVLLPATLSSHVNCMISHGKSTVALSPEC